MMSDDAKVKLYEILWKLIVPVLASLIVGFGTGYLGAERAIGQLQVRVDRMELVQDRLVEQQKQDGQMMVRIETKLDMLLNMQHIKSTVDER
jgi:hypothetical protein